MDLCQNFKTFGSKCCSCVKARTTPTLYRNFSNLCSLLSLCQLLLGPCYIYLWYQVAQQGNNYYLQHTVWKNGKKRAIKEKWLLGAKTVQHLWNLLEKVFLLMEKIYQSRKTQIGPIFLIFHDFHLFRRNPKIG